MILPRPAEFPTLVPVAAVTNDPRLVSPPCFLIEVRQLEADGVCAVLRTIRVHAIAPGPDHGDALSWLWDTAAPLLALLPQAGPVEGDDWQDYPSIRTDITEGVAL